LIHNFSGPPDDKVSVPPQVLGSLDLPLTPMGAPQSTNIVGVFRRSANLSNDLLSDFVGDESEWSRSGVVGPRAIAWLGVRVELYSHWWGPHPSDSHASYPGVCVRSTVRDRALLLISLEATEGLQMHDQL
jgi:hypothetical protein